MASGTTPSTHATPSHKPHQCYFVTAPKLPSQAPHTAILGDLYALNACARLIVEADAALSQEAVDRSQGECRRDLSRALTTAADRLYDYIEEYLGEAAADRTTRLQLKRVAEGARADVLSLQTRALVGDTAVFAEASSMGGKYMRALLTGEIPKLVIAPPEVSPDSRSDEANRRRMWAAAAAFCVFTGGIVGIRYLTGEVSSFLAVAGATSGVLTLSFIVLGMFGERGERFLRLPSTGAETKDKA